MPKTWSTSLNISATSLPTRSWNALYDSTPPAGELGQLLLSSLHGDVTKPAALPTLLDLWILQRSLLLQTMLWGAQHFHSLKETGYDCTLPCSPHPNPKTIWSRCKVVLSHLLIDDILILDVAVNTPVGHKLIDCISMWSWTLLFFRTFLVKKSRKKTELLIISLALYRMPTFVFQVWAVRIFICPVLSTKTYKKLLPHSFS